ncbi:MAG TPA: type II/IV secretion system ATPase subunit [Nitrososphaerales archaeon]|nr:type II/IV secretion system ATPase subunit [Nitrososphaerales archaeon]
MNIPRRKAQQPVVEEAAHPPTGKRLSSDSKVLERYQLEPPFSYAVIAEPMGSVGKQYFVDEIGLSQPEVEAYAYILRAMENELVIPRKKVDPRQYFRVEAKKVAQKYSLALPRLAWSKILYYAERDIAGFGVLDGLMRDPNIEDISVDGIHNPVLVYHRKYERMPTNIVFDDELVLNDLIARFAHVAGKHISVAFPIMQGILPGGHRVMATFRKEVSPHGGTMSIRKFKDDPITIVDMLSLGVLDPTAAAYIWMLMENRATAIVVGATGAGKTTMLNALLTLTPVNSKIVTIEEVQEINLAHRGWTALISREAYGLTEEGPKGVNLFDLVKAAMRMRPDVMVVGEVRGEEAYVLFQAISTGHGGLCTLHADDTQSAIQRLISKPMDVPEAFIPFLNLAVTVRRLTITSKDGGTRAVRRVISIDEVNTVGKYDNMFTYNPATDTLAANSLRKSKRLQKIAKDRGLTISQAEDEVQRRALVLAWMQKKGLRNFKEITQLFQEYVEHPDRVMARTKEPILEEKHDTAPEVVA